MQPSETTLAATSTGTTLSGEYEGDQIWDAVNSPYVLTGDVTIYGSLQVKPGTIIEGNGKRVNINGQKLIMDGTEDSNIHISNVKFSARDGSIDHVTMEKGELYGGQSDTNLQIQDSSFSNLSYLSGLSFYNNKIIRVDGLSGKDFTKNVIDQAVLQIYQYEKDNISMINNLIINSKIFGENDQQGISTFYKNSIYSTNISFWDGAMAKIRADNNYWATNSISEILGNNPDGHLEFDEILRIPDKDTPPLKDLTTVNKFTSADRVLTGKTSPNSYVIVKNSNEPVNYLNHSSYTRMAQSDKNGNFKLFIGLQEKSSKFDLLTISQEGETIDYDRVYVYSASLSPSIDSIAANKGVMTGRTEKDTKVAVLKDGNFVASTTSGGSFKLNLPEYPAGTFLTIQLSKGTIKNELHDMVVGGEIAFTPTTIWSSSLSGKTFPYAIVRFYSNKQQWCYFCEKPKNLEFQANDSGEFYQKIDPLILNKNIVDLYEPIYQNLIYEGSAFQLRSTAPTIQPISQLSKTILGTATPGSQIDVLDETGDVLGTGKTDKNGNYRIGVETLTAGSLLTVQSGMPNTNKIDESQIDVEEVYVGDITENDTAITGSSSFGTSGEVSVVTPEISGISQMAVKTRKYGPFAMQKGKTFKFQTGILPARSKVIVSFNENGKKLILPEKIVKAVNKKRSAALKTSQIAIYNNTGKSDQIKVTRIQKGAVIKVFNASTKGSPIIAKKITTSTALLTFKQLGKNAGKIYVSITNPGMTESVRVGAAYKAEKKRSTALKGSQITVYNYKGKSDKIKITKIRKGSVIKVFKSNSTGSPVASKKAYSTTATVFVKQLGKKSGKVYISITNPGLIESVRISEKYSGEK
ncbi:Ig-like domain-containing protein [Neobacillus cucumis]|nr:Ig-like domain-containing protein [Neobacillus cucumis]